VDKPVLNRKPPTVLETAPPIAHPSDDTTWLLGRLSREDRDAAPADERERDLLARMRLEELLGLIERLLPVGGRAAAINAYRAWIDANPLSPQQFAAWFNLGVEFAKLGDNGNAIRSYQNALLLKPALYQAAVNLGTALEAEGRNEEALRAWQEALQPVEARIALLNNRGRLLENMGRFAEAERELYASLLLQPDQPDVIHHWSHLRQRTCQWPIFGPPVPGLTADELMRRQGPLGSLALCDDPAIQAQIAEEWLRRRVPAAPTRLSPPEGYAHDRIRVGYMSSDFCRHAVSFLIVDLLERHDRSRFEIFGYCSSREDGSDIRRRVIEAFDHHVPVKHLGDADLAHRIRADEIDILIDLNGLTLGARLETLRWKPAPVQMTYLGFIGSVPLPELDYLLCDDYVIPRGSAHLYAPQPLYLPGLYQANDSAPVDLPAVSREEEGLPADKFVFCCFSHYYKITEAVFGAWIEILGRVPDSVLWLIEDDETGKANLLRRAADAGIAPERLIFASRVAPERYLARFALADLFLDTCPYNAGTVASDALRMGLPIVTLSGRTYSSRMAGSLLHAIGLSECVAHALGDYVGTAVSLGTDRARHARVKGAIAGDAWARTIGNSAVFVRQVEKTLERVRILPPGAPMRGASRNE